MAKKARTEQFKEHRLDVKHYEILVDICASVRLSISYLPDSFRSNKLFRY